MKIGKITINSKDESPDFQKAKFDNPQIIISKHWKKYLMKTNPEEIYYKDLNTDSWIPVVLDNTNTDERKDQDVFFTFKSKIDKTKTFVAQTYMEFILVSHASDTPLNRTIHTVKKSFSTSLTELGGEQTELLIRNFSACADKFSHPGNVYAPYLPICQSSGFGKSRVTSECGRRLISIYAVFRLSTDNGFPYQANWTSQFKSFVDRATEDDIPLHAEYSLLTSKVGRVLIYIDIVMRAFMDWFKFLVGPAIFMKLTEKDKLSKEDIKILSEVYDNITEYFKSKDDQIKYFNDTISNHVSKCNEFDNSNATGIADSISEVAQFFVPINKIVSQFKDQEEIDAGTRSAGFMTLDPNSDAHPFLFILDELSIYSKTDKTPGINFTTAVRRALHFLLPSKNILFVTLGTNCDVSVLSKPVKDNSLRFLNRSNLIFPLLFPGSWDIYYNEGELHNLVIDVNLLTNKKTLLLLISFGRALWSSILVKEVFAIASTKLLNGSNGGDEPYIASWCIRSGLTVNANQILAEKLLSSHMATLLSVSKTGEEIYVDYSSEPVLAMAARDIVKEHATRMFQALLHVIERIPVDKGRITEVVFSEILLRGIENAERIKTTSNANPTGASEVIKKIFSTKVFILEQSLEPEVNPSLLMESTLNQYYHVTTVESFIKTTFAGMFSNDAVKNIPDLLKGGLVNASQFIQLNRDFPYQAVYYDKDGQDEYFKGEKNKKIPFKNVYEELPDASGDLGKRCNIIDKAMLQLGLLRQCAYTMPEGYYGIDFIIPVAVKMGDDNNSRTFFSYISIQSKAGNADPIETLIKMNPNLHVQRNCFDDDEWEFLVENHLAIVVSAKNDADCSPDSLLCSITSEFRATGFCIDDKVKIADIVKELLPQFANEKLNGFKSLKKPKYDTKKVESPEPLPNNPGSTIEASSGTKSENDVSSAPREKRAHVKEIVPTTAIEVDIVPTTAMEVDETSANKSGNNSNVKVPQPQKFAAVHLSKDFNVSKMKWDNCTMSCIWSNSVNVFETLLGDTATALAKQIIYHTRDIISIADPIQRKSIGYAMLNSRFAAYPNSDRLLRQIRGQNAIEPFLTNFRHWKGLN